MNQQKLIFLVIVTLLCLHPIISSAENPKIIWKESTPDGEMPSLPLIAQADNGNIYIVENHYDSQEKKVSIHFWKYSQDGRKLFEKLLAAPWSKSLDSRIASIIVTKNEKIFLFGDNFNSASDSNVWVLEYDSNGNQKNYQSYKYKESIAVRKVIELEDHFLVLGSKEFRRIWMARFSKDGSKTWEHIIENNRDEDLMSAALNKNNHLAMIASVGKRDKFGIGKTTLFLATYKLNGEKIKEYTFQGRILSLNNIITDDLSGQNFLVSYDDNVLPNGEICNPANLTEGYSYILKISSDLEVIWKKNYEKKILIIGTPLIGKIADRYIITGKGNLSMASGKSDFPWFALVDENGNVISKRSISESLLFSPSDMVTGKKHCLIVGSEMDMSEDKLKNNMIIFKIGIE